MYSSRDAGAGGLHVQGYAEGTPNTTLTITGTTSGKS